MWLKFFCVIEVNRNFNFFTFNNMYIVSLCPSIFFLNRHVPLFFNFEFSRSFSFLRKIAKCLNLKDIFELTKFNFSLVISCKRLRFTIKDFVAQGYFYILFSNWFTIFTNNINIIILFNLS